MKERKSQYSIWAPIIRKKIEEEKTKKEENGEKLTKEEIKNIIKKEKRKCHRRATWIAITAALGITAGTKGIKLLEAPKDNNIKIEEQVNNENKRKSFIEKNKVNTTIEKQEEKFKLKDTLAEYNYNIESENIGYIESNPAFLYVDDNKNYIFDYKEKTDVDNYIRNDKENKIGKMYTLVNKKNNTIISSIGEVNSKIVNIDTKQVKDLENKEYEQEKNTLDLTKKYGKEKTQEELEKMYSSIQKEHQKSKEQKEIEER